MNKDTFTCKACGETFDKGRTEEEALAELGTLFPGVSVEDTDIVCDDCWRAMGFSKETTAETVPTVDEAVAGLLGGMRVD